jgi:hypothetical protein
MAASFLKYIDYTTRHAKIQHLSPGARSGSPCNPTSAHIEKAAQPPAKQGLCGLSSPVFVVIAKKSCAFSVEYNKIAQKYSSM